MARPSTDKRQRILHAAATVVHSKGFRSASLADIARLAVVPVGSVYYFFKSKDQLASAIIDEQAVSYGALASAWEAHPDPRERLASFLQMSVHNRQSLAEFGCPVATLTGELQKDGGALGLHASSVFANLLRWLQRQFEDLGYHDKAADHARHVLAAIEGAALLTHSFHDPSYVVHEAERLTTWIRSLPQLEVA